MSICDHNNTQRRHQREAGKMCQQNMCKLTEVYRKSKQVDEWSQRTQPKNLERGSRDGNYKRTRSAKTTWHGRAQQKQSTCVSKICVSVHTHAPSFIYCIDTTFKVRSYFTKFALAHTRTGTLKCWNVDDSKFSCPAISTVTRIFSSTLSRFSYPNNISLVRPLSRALHGDWEWLMNHRLKA